MASRGGMFVIDGIGPVLDVLVISAATNVERAMNRGKEKIEEYARQNAPWNDRSGMARDGLVADVYLEGGEVVLELAHSVDYGYWLEIIQDGQFAIIMPTLEALGPEILADAGGAVMITDGGF